MDFTPFVTSSCLWCPLQELTEKQESDLQQLIQMVSTKEEESNLKQSQLEEKLNELELLRENMKGNVGGRGPCRKNGKNTVSKTG